MLLGIGTTPPLAPGAPLHPSGADRQPVRNISKSSKPLLRVEDGGEGWRNAGGGRPTNGESRTRSPRTRQVPAQSALPNLPPTPPVVLRQPSKRPNRKRPDVFGMDSGGNPSSVRDDGHFRHGCSMLNNRAITSASSGIAVAVRSFAMISAMRWQPFRRSGLFRQAPAAR